MYYSLIPPSTPLASLMGGSNQGASGYAPPDDKSPQAVLGRIANGQLAGGLPPAITQPPPGAGAQARGLGPPGAGPPGGIPGVTDPRTFPAIGAAAAQASPDSGGFPKLFNDQGGIFGDKGPVSGVLDNPKRVALIMAGLGAWTPQGIAGGFQQGMQYLHGQQSIDQGAKRLEEEANYHAGLLKKADLPYEKMTAAQEAAAKQHEAQMDLLRQKEALEAGKPLGIGRYDPQTGQEIKGVRDPNNPGRFLDPVSGEPIDVSKLPPITSGGQQQQQPTSNTVVASADGIIPANNNLVAQSAKQGYDYSQDAPLIEKGMEVPTPQATAGHSSAALQTDAEYYLQTGKLPPTKGGKSPVAVAQQNYRNAVQNYGAALAQSRGITPEQTAEMWRTAPGMLRFILGVDGRSTVALGTAVRHLDTLKQFADAWKANDTQTINRLRSVISREFGSEAATNLEAAGRIVGPEIIKAIGIAGAGTEHERQAAESGFGTTASPEQMSGAINVTQRLLGGQLEGKKRQALNAGLTEERFKSLIGDRPYELLSNADKTPVAGAAAAAGAKPVKVSTPEEARKLPKGTPIILPDGRTGTVP
jgi:hypothetical protein